MRRLRDCDWTSCKNPAVRRAGDCLLCGKHLCITHLRKQWHKCPTPEEDWDLYSAGFVAAQERYMKELCSRVSVPDLCARASMLRQGNKCEIQLSPKHLLERMGNQNCHALVTFEDGVQWLARFRLTWTSSPPRKVRDCITRSEAATFLYLKSHTLVPTPTVYDWACESDPGNNVGVSYILMEKLEGEPLDWQTTNTIQKEKIMQQLVDIFLEIAMHPFKTMGSLVVSNANQARFDVKGLANHNLFGGGDGDFLGPFSSALDGTRAILETNLHMIRNGEIQGCHPTDIYLAHLHRQEYLDDVWTSESAEGQFFLKHPDDKGDHILVDEFCNIVGIIDWETASTVPKEEAFCSPCMMWPVQEFYDGCNELAKDELRLAQIFRDKGRDDLAQCVIDGRKIQRFFFDIGPLGTFNNYETFISLFTGMQRAFGSDVGWEQHKLQALKRLRDDESLKTVQKLEQGGECVMANCHSLTEAGRGA